MTTSHNEGRTQRLVDLDVSWMVPADLRVVDALARLQVVALRQGRTLEIHGADPGLAELLELVGLDLVVHLCRRCRAPDADSDDRRRRKPEDPEQ